MKVKAIIFRPDRTNDIVVLKAKEIRGKTFRYNDCTYFLHPDRFQVTWSTRLWIKYAYRSTYYYAMGHSLPLPVPDFGYLALKEGAIFKTKDTNAPPEEPPEIDIEAMKKAGFFGILDNGIPAEELAAIFNPWFYQIIAGPGKDFISQLQFYLSIASAAGIAYIILKLHQGG